MWRSDNKNGPCEHADLTYLRIMRPDIVNFVHDDGTTSDEHDAEQEAQELGKWLERKERNDRALADRRTPPRLLDALLRLNVACEEAIARITAA